MRNKRLNAHCRIYASLLLLIIPCGHSDQRLHSMTRHLQYANFDYFDNLIEAREREQTTFRGEAGQQRILQVYAPATRRFAQILMISGETPLSLFDETGIVRVVTKSEFKLLILTVFLDAPAGIVVKYPGYKHESYDETLHKRITWVPLTNHQLSQLKILLRAANPHNWTRQPWRRDPSTAISIEYKTHDQLFFTKKCLSFAVNPVGRFIFLAAKLEVSAPKAARRIDLSQPWGVD